MCPRESVIDLTRVVLLIATQIRIVTNSHDAIGEDGKPKKKKKKPHCGYAFIVYERERDMKGT